MVLTAAGAGASTNCGSIGVLHRFFGRNDMSSCAGMLWRLRGGAALVSAFLVIAACGRLACAETLEQALTDAYLINPVLNAERTRLRATDEQVALAKAGLRPFISGEADTSFQNQNSDIDIRRSAGGQSSSASGASASAAGIGSSGVTNPRGVSVQLTQPLFEGFQNLNAIRGAKSRRFSPRARACAALSRRCCSTP